MQTKQWRARRYCRFYTGRRTGDDDRQIGRWKGVAGEKGRWKRQLVKQCVTKNKCALCDAGVCRCPLLIGVDLHAYAQIVL